MLPQHITEWWDIANGRRQRLINRKNKKEDLSTQQQFELKMLQGVADLVMSYGSTVWCKLCGEELKLRDRGWFPTHSCKKRKR